MSDEVEEVEVESAPPANRLEAPREGIPHVIETEEQLATAISSLAHGTGPVAIDAERASGYRYSSRAYLVQLRRQDAGSFLIDPTFFSDLASLNSALNDAEWILHAATQDLMCLREVGIHPSRLFDTEHAGRLLGKPKVGLSSLLESELDVSLAKEHSAADWSTRPIPEPWLNYAALDVELLIELRETLLQQLHERDRWSWAEQEFEYLVSWQPSPPPEDPWRRLSGIHTIRDARQLAVARELWTWRDQLGRERDKAVGRLLSDAAILDVAKSPLKSARDVYMLSSLRNRSHKAHADKIWEIRQAALALPESQLPQTNKKSGALPPPKAWADRNPEAAARWEKIRPALNAIAEELEIAPEVLVSPEPIRQFCWDPTTALDSLDEWLHVYKVRQWQIDFILPILLTTD